MVLTAPVLESVQTTLLVPQEAHTNLWTFIGLLVFAPPTHSLAGLRFSSPQLGRFLKRLDHFAFLAK